MYDIILFMCQSWDKYAMTNNPRRVTCHAITCTRVSGSPNLTEYAEDTLFAIMWILDSDGGFLGGMLESYTLQSLN